jgi:hypothetical protein
MNGRTSEAREAGPSDPADNEGAEGWSCGLVCQVKSASSADKIERSKKGWIGDLRIFL